MASEKHDTIPLLAATPEAAYGATCEHTVVTVEEDDGQAEDQGGEMRATCTFLEPGTPEYRMVAVKFFDTLQEGPLVIDRIAKVNNPTLRLQYCRKRAEMTKRNRDIMNEQLLFHGTASSNVDSICCNGFDPTLAGKVNGYWYGQGSYFTERSEKAIDFSSPANNSIWPFPLTRRYFPRLLGSATRPYRPQAVTAASLDLPPGKKAARMRGNRGHVLLCSVLTGRTVIGEHLDTQPPLINPDQPELGRYDTCCKNELTMSTMVLFNKDQVYPTYVVEYRFPYDTSVLCPAILISLFFLSTLTLAITYVALH